MAQEKTVPMTILLTPMGHKQLEEIAKAKGQSKAQIVRESLANYYAHCLAQKPTCSDGRPCLAPQLHGVMR